VDLPVCDCKYWLGPAGATVTNYKYTSTLELCLFGILLSTHYSLYLTNYNPHMMIFCSTFDNVLIFS
jgi:hypothetical protein